MTKLSINGIGRRVQALEEQRGVGTLPGHEAWVDAFGNPERMAEVERRYTDASPRAIAARLRTLEPLA